MHYSARVSIYIFISVSECLFVSLCLSVSTCTTLFWWGGGVRGRVCMCLCLGLSVFSPYLIVFLFFLPLCLILVSISPFPLIIHNTEKPKLILDYLLYFIWCYCVFTWSKIYRYSSIPLSFDRSCGFAVNYCQNRH